MNFIDWIPAIFSALGMLIINSIDKSRLSADNFSYSGDGVAWKARVVLFMGFAAMAGGLAGAITVLILKYVIGEAQWPALWFGLANVVANALVMLRWVPLRRASHSTLTYGLQFRRPLAEPKHGRRLYLQSSAMTAGMSLYCNCIIYQPWLAHEVSHTTPEV